MQTNIAKSAKYFILMLTALTAHAEDFQYFNGQINFWNEKPPTKSTPAPQSTAPKGDQTPSTDSAATEGAFPWAKYLDPKNKEFFKEGDYTPPEPFMEIVRNPTDQNLKLWFSYMDKKNELSTRLQTKMQEYMQRKGLTIEPQARESMNQRVASLPQIEPEAKRYRFRMYFDSHCPHCKRMFSTMTALQERGFFVEGLQVDGSKGNILQLSFPTAAARPEDLKSKGVQSVPQLFVGDMKKKIVFRLSGYQSLSDVYQAIASAEAKP